MGKFNEIKAALKTLVQGIQMGGSSACVDVFTYGTNDFSGYPSAAIVNGEITSEYHTTTQVLRTYTTYVYLYANLEQTDQQQAWDTLTDLQELVIDAIDHTENLAPAADFVRPTAVSPLETNAGEGGKLLVAPVKVEASWSFYFK